MSKSARLLTARQVAARLQISPESVRRWARLSKIKSHKFGLRCVRFEEGDIEEFIEQHRSLKNVDVQGIVRKVLTGPLARKQR